MEHCCTVVNALSEEIFGGFFSTVQGEEKSSQRVEKHISNNGL